jgi:hypothetical protein
MACRVGPYEFILIFFEFFHIHFFLILLSLFSHVSTLRGLEE